MAMSAILGQSYSSVEVHTDGGMPLAHCRTAASYTGFDMGSGEASAIAILSAGEGLPAGGLLLIEEIEHGFHPQAQERLIRELTRLVLKDKKQVVCTTRSEYIIDALPRAGRLLVERKPGPSDRSRPSLRPTRRRAYRYRRSRRRCSQCEFDRLPPRGPSALSFAAESERPPLSSRLGSWSGSSSARSTSLPNPLHYGGRHTARPTSAVRGSHS